ncbi:MAG: hypothetical protein K0Q94_3345 [Paenibacillus sp.]|nr:hypothetical protein [Paenibacillus sp.]
MPVRPLWRLDNAEVTVQAASGPRKVLQGLNLAVGEGEYIAVVGCNGSGKSTLLRVLGGLCPLSGGSLTADGEASRQPGYVFQNPDAQIVGETVYEEVCFGMENRGVPPEEMAERFRRAMVAAGMDVHPDTPVERLSGGQKQLLCIAGAMVTGAQSLLLDEPASMLDLDTRSAVLRIARELHERGATIVWATQSMDELVPATRVIALVNGGIAYDGTPERFFYGSAGNGRMFDPAETPCLSLGFRPPYAIQVAHRLLQIGIELGECPMLDGQLRRAVTELCR